MWMQMQNWGWGMMGLGGLVMLLFWIVVIIGIVALVKWLFGTSSSMGYRPLDLLKARYAKGEITKEQFEQMRRDIEA